jgi:ABC-2 type transport system ATP-binding protein
LLDRLNADLQITERGPNWFRYRTLKPEDVNPAVLKRLAQLDQPVITLSEVERSLEDVYLKIVEQ